jgi:hypothetical protein
MLIARQIAHALQDLCPGLTPEATAAALGIELRPAPCARYRYTREPARVEYDSLADPGEQERMLERAIVLHALGSLRLAPGSPSIIAVTEQVWAHLRLAAAGATKRSA